MVGKSTSFPTFLCPARATPCCGMALQINFNMDNDFYQSHASKQKRSYQIQNPRQMLEEQIQTVDSR